MDYELGGVTGDWGPQDWRDSDATVAPNGPQVQGNSVLTQSTTAAGQDKWTGFFQNLVGDAAKYAIQRDAVKHGLQPATAANGQPVYMQAPPTVAGVPSGLLLIGGAVLVAVLLVASKKG